MWSGVLAMGAWLVLKQPMAKRALNGQCHKTYKEPGYSHRSLGGHAARDEGCVCRVEAVRQQMSGLWSVCSAESPGRAAAGDSTTDWTRRRLVDS
jgi:hypothetical protein